MALDAFPPVDPAALSAAFKALGDENRLRAFALIAARGRICVGDLVTVLDLPQSTVSRHLAALRRTGLVVTERAGTWVHYALAESPPMATPAEAVARLLEGADAFAEDLSRAASLAAGGGCCPQHPPAKGA